MSGGLAALLDDVAAIARAAAASVDDVTAAAAKASSHAVGVVVDDTAVTPRYVTGFTPDRELPVIWRIAKGSIRNKTLIILPVILILSQFLPALLTPLLMLGGLYLSYEGAEKIWESVSGHSAAKEAPAIVKGENYEDHMVNGAIRTDLILSAEIMVISLNDVAYLDFLMRAATLVMVAFIITALVYGVVALIVKMDDVGVKMAENPRTERLGEGLVRAMPHVLSGLSTVGVAAMLWVGGHILLTGVNDLGWTWLYDIVHHWSEAAAEAAGGFVGWLVETAASLAFGLAIGAVAVVVMHLVHKILPKKKDEAAEAH